MALLEGTEQTHPSVTGKEALSQGKNSPVLKRFFRFYNYILNSSAIRQFDNPFIPLFFHWSGGYIKRRLLRD
jgi:hypothetical protein